jgi:[acyl-carrier-protein] S-malonyltransferase
MKAFVFPGQGAQFPGMGKSLYEENPTAKAFFEQANEILAFRITDIMFDGTDEQRLLLNLCLIWWLATLWENFPHW